MLATQMNPAARDYCSRAIAYLKMETPDDGRPEIALRQAESPVIRPLGHGLLVVYLVDEGDHFSWVQQRHLTDAGVSELELHSQAIKNLAVFAEQHAEVRSYGNIFIVLSGGNFEASMLLLNEFWSEWYANLAQNGFVVAFPARDILAFGDIASESVVSELLAVCERLIGNADHPLSPVLYQRTNSGWEPFGG